MENCFNIPVIYQDEFTIEVYKPVDLTVRKNDFMQYDGANIHVEFGTLFNFIWMILKTKNEIHPEGIINLNSPDEFHFSKNEKNFPNYTYTIERAYSFTEFRPTGNFFSTSFISITSPLATQSISPANDFCMGSDAESSCACSPSTGIC